jgi:polysaccharide biosynthesis protein PslG
VRLVGRRRQRRAFATSLPGILTALGCVVAVGLVAQPHPPRRVTAVPATTIDVSPSTVGVSALRTFGMGQTDLDDALDAIRASGVRVVRLSIPWAAVRPTPDVTDWTSVDRTVDAAASRGLAVVGVVTAPPARPGTVGTPAGAATTTEFAAFVAATVTRFRGRLAAVEVGSDPNLSPPRPPDAGSYVALLRAVYPAVKAADPAVLVICGALASATGAWDPVEFLRRMYAAGAAGSFDAVGFHPQTGAVPFSAGLPLPHSPVNQLIGLRLLMVDNGDVDKRIWATEYDPADGITGRDERDVVDLLTSWRQLPYAGPAFVPSAPVDQIVSVPEQTRFAAVADQRLGSVLSPVFRATPATWAQIRTAATVYETPTGFVASPNPVAATALGLAAAPTGPFAGGYQDFDGSAAVRIWYSPQTCAWAGSAAIAAAWTPDLGLAVGAERRVGDTSSMDFQHGTVTTASGTPATVLRAEHPAPVGCATTAEDPTPDPPAGTPPRDALARQASTPDSPRTAPVPR